MKSKRIASVDVLRGFTIAAMIMVNTPGSWATVFPPLLHAEWNGYTPTDLVFPFFLFIVGISIAIVYGNKKIEKPSAYKKIAIRSLKIIGLGLFLNWFVPYVPFFKDFDALRFPGVLQRIGVVFFITSIVFINCNWKALLGVGVAILVGYWLWLGFIPLPDGTSPTFDRAVNNWANFVDVGFFGSHMYKSDYDPEGLISTLPAVVSCISGALIGLLLISKKTNKGMMMAIIGVVMLVVGHAWDLFFPINKALWSSSFVLVTSGWACVLLALLYYVMDVKNIRFGSLFKYAGMNAITVYFLSSFIAKSFSIIKVGDSTIHGSIYSVYKTSFFSANMSSFLYAISVVAFYLLVAYIMYKKKIFIKI